MAEDLHHLRADGVSIVVDTSHGTPALLHWGADLGPLDDGQLASLRTAIGDAVNLASRIEGLTKSHGSTVLVSDATRALIGDRLSFTAAPPVPVKGKSLPVETFVPGPLSRPAGPGLARPSIG